MEQERTSAGVCDKGVAGRWMGWCGGQEKRQSKHGELCAGPCCASLEAKKKIQCWGKRAAADRETEPEERGAGREQNCGELAAGKHREWAPTWQGCWEVVLF